MKDINEMTLEELQKEMDELWPYLYMTKETVMYDNFNWNGLDYWDADRRYHKISQKVLLHNIENKKLWI